MTSKNQSFETLKNQFDSIVNLNQQTIETLEKQLQSEREINKKLLDIETNRYTLKGLIKTVIGIIAKTSTGDFGKKIFFLYLRTKNTKLIGDIKTQCHEKDNNLIIEFPIIDWNFRKQRPQHIVSRLKTYKNVVLFGCSSVLQKKKYSSPSNSKSVPSFTDFKLSNLEPKIFQYKFYGQSSFNIYSGTISNEQLKMMFKSLNEIINFIKPKKITYLIHFPGWWPLVKETQEFFGGKIIYDCMDDHIGFSNTNESIVSAENEILKNADLVLASSIGLEKKCRQSNQNTILIRNATEYEHFHNNHKNGKLNHLLDKPIMGYYGAIAEWFDEDLILYCANQRRDWNFVLIGAVTNSYLDKLEALDNVHLIGEVEYSRLPGYLAYFDVAMIPFIINQLTEATNPVKFYEYLSAGKPVVATPIPELTEYSDICYIAQDKDHFLESLDKAYSKKDSASLINKYYDLAQQNTWDARVKKIIQHAQYLR